MIWEATLQLKYIFRTFFLFQTLEPDCLGFGQLPPLTTQSWHRPGGPPIDQQWASPQSTLYFRQHPVSLGQVQVVTQPHIDQRLTIDTSPRRWQRSLRKVWPHSSPQATIISGSRSSTELCVQQGSPYCGMCWFRFSVQRFTPSLLHHVNSSGKESRMMATCGNENDFHEILHERCSPSSHSGNDFLAILQEHTSFFSRVYVQTPRTSVKALFLSNRCKSLRSRTSTNICRSTRLWSPSAASQSSNSIWLSVSRALNSEIHPPTSSPLRKCRPSCSPSPPIPWGQVSLAANGPTHHAPLLATQ